MATEKERRETVAAILKAVVAFNKLTDHALKQDLRTTTEVDDNGDLFIVEIERLYYEKEE